MTSIQPQLWVDAPREAIAFYEAAFGATVLHLVGDGDDVVAQLGVDEGAFWVAGASAAMKRLSPSSSWSSTRTPSSGTRSPRARRRRRP
jgi:PhnB protein